MVKIHCFRRIPAAGTSTGETGELAGTRARAECGEVPEFMISLVQGASARGSEP